MALYERISGQDGFTKLEVHKFGAAIMAVARGDITRAMFDSVLEMTGDDITEVDSLVANYAAKATAVEKLEYLLYIEKIAVLMETGELSKAQAQTLLGF